jgi:hypothetical protein
MRHARWLHLADEKCERRNRDLVGRLWRFFACPGTDSLSARFQNQEEHSPLAMRAATFVNILVMIVAGLNHRYVFFSGNLN